MRILRLLIKLGMHGRKHMIAEQRAIQYLTDVEGL